MKTLVLSLIFITQNFAAGTAQQKGLSIAKKMKVANEGFVGEEAEMTMILIDAQGGKITRSLKGQTMEVIGDGDKSLSTFLNPKDVKGTKMLTWSHKNEDDDQWLFLPSLRRVKRISSRSKSSSFMGSEFSYEDLGSQEIDKYNFKWLKDDSYRKKAVYVLERVPKQKSGYSKMVMYIGQNILNPFKIEYYDRKGEVLKVALFSKFKKYNVRKKQIWRANKIHMKNTQTKKESIFEWKNRKVGVVHKERDFKKTSLK